MLTEGEREQITDGQREPGHQMGSPFGSLPPRVIDLLDRSPHDTLWAFALGAAFVAIVSETVAGADDLHASDALNVNASLPM